MDEEYIWDLFICHASEDKSWVQTLANTLRSRGWSVWYDKFELTIGDSLRRRIDHGLTKSRFGVVVLSKNFFIKEFPNRELDGLAAREIDGKKVILPIWHGVSRQDIEHYSPTLADKLAVSTDRGIDAVVEEIERALIEPESPARIFMYKELPGRDEQIEMGIRMLRDHRPIVRATVALDLGFRGRTLPIEYRQKIGKQMICLLYDREAEVRGNGAWAIGELFKELPAESKEIVKFPLEFLLNDDEECSEVDDDHILHHSRVAYNAKNALIKIGLIEK